MDVFWGIVVIGGIFGLVYLRSYVGRRADEARRAREDRDGSA